MSDIWYVPRDSLVRVEEVESIGLKGDYVATNIFDEKYIISKSDFKDKYVKVKLAKDLDKACTYKKEEIEEMYKNYYSETTENDRRVQEEDWSSLQSAVRQSK